METEKKRDVILVGGGGHASSLLESFGSRICGYIALSPSPSLPLEWLGTDDCARDYKQSCLFNMAFVYSGTPTMALRKKIIGEYKDKGCRFATLISPLALVSPNSKVGEGSVIMPGAIINKAEIGSNSIVNTGAIIEHDCRIGDNVFIGPGVVIGGFVEIEKDSFIGLGAKIRNGIRITSGVTVGMGSIVTKDILSPGIYYGII